MLKVGIIGAGLIGRKRATALSHSKLIAVTDTVQERAQSLARDFLAEVTPDADTLIKRSDIDCVIVATANNAITPIAIEALRAGKHVLVEKPAGRNPKDLSQLVAASNEGKGILRVGFNHRFHPAFQKAVTLIREGAIGPLMYIRARYGHGGRLGYNKEWRANPELSGGGELLDQGVHLIDLCRWLGGEFELECGRADTFFWNMPVDDNGFMLLKSPDSKTRAFLHASCTEWKNLFDFEIFGRDGKLQIWGLGRSYGTEELRFYKMKPEMGPPDFHSESFTGEDLSWNKEFEAFASEIQGGKSDIGTAFDAYRALKIVYDVYEQSGLPGFKNGEWHS